MYFIACYAPDLHGAKVADGLARVSIRNKLPHIAFHTKELAQYYVDSRNASKLCYLISEEDISETIWHDFSDGVALFKSIKEIRKAISSNSDLYKISQLAYSPQIAQFL